MFDVQILSQDYFMSVSCDIASVQFHENYYENRGLY